MSTGPEDGSRDDERPLVRLLDRKRDGVAVLVAGAVPPSVHRSMSARLLGSPDADRRRVLALTRSDPAAVSDRLPPGAATSPDRFRAVVGDGWTRSAAGDTDTDAGSSVDLSTEDGLSDDALTVLDTPALSTFGDHLASDVGSLDRLAGGFAPGQLRLCLDSLDHLADGYDDHALQFVTLLADQVRSNDGMAHFHTTRPSDQPPIPGVRNVASVTIRLRRTGEAPEFRPHLDGDALTDWRRLPPLLG